MVGTLRSTRCENCRIRKKRCDGAHTFCGGCQASGWPCPGYRRRWKFVSQNRHLSSIYASNKHIFEDDLVNKEDTLTLEPFHGVFGPTNIELFEVHHSSEYSFHVGVFDSKIPMAKSERIGYMLGRLLENRSAWLVFPIVNQGTFLRYISCRIGWNEALDTAMECFCRIWTDYIRKSLLAPGSKLAKEPGCSTEALILYGKSIRALNKCLIKGHGRKYDSETLCASIVLQFCELSLNADKGRWYQLIKGTSLLIQSCGPSRFTESFERSMLESQWSFFISNAIPQSPSGQEESWSNYLARPEWRQILSSYLWSSDRPLVISRISPSPQAPKNAIALRAAVFDHFVDIPNILHAGFKLLFSDGCTQTDAEAIEELRAQVLELRNELEEWYAFNLLPLVTSSQWSPSPSLSPELERDDSRHEYNTFPVAVLDCIVNAVIICLDHLFTSLSFAQFECDELNSPYPAWRLTNTKRHEIWQNALSYVQTHLPLAAKPLEYSLKRLWKYDCMISRSIN